LRRLIRYIRYPSVADFAVVGAVEEARPTGTAMEDHVGYGKAVVR